MPHVYITAKLKSGQGVSVYMGTLTSVGASSETYFSSVQNTSWDDVIPAGGHYNFLLEARAAPNSETIVTITNGNGAGAPQLATATLTSPDGAAGTLPYAKVDVPFDV